MAMKVYFDNLFTDFGHVSLNKKKESLCGDFYVEQEKGSDSVLVLSDGLGSGVKANILATLTAQMLCTMMMKKMPLGEAVETVATTLPVCSVRQLAYSTFTVLKLSGRMAYLAQYDNPAVILLRDGKSLDYEKKFLEVEEKIISESQIPLQKDDVLILMSDGVTNAGMGKTTDGGWGRESVVRFCEKKYKKEMSAQNLANAIAGACVDLNLNETDDDITVIVIKLCERQTVNVMIGPPKDMEKDKELLSIFFKTPGKHIVCGGTTAGCVANYLEEKVITLDNTATNDIPAMSRIKGVDLVTEGLLTLRKLNNYTARFYQDKMELQRIQKLKDPAALLFEELFFKASNINIFFGNALNPAYKTLRIDEREKQKLVNRLKDNLEKSGKTVKMSIW